MEVKASRSAWRRRDPRAWKRKRRFRLERPLLHYPPRARELNLLAASTRMAFLSLPAPCSDDGDGPPNALNAMRHPHLQPDVQPTTTRVDELHTRTHTRRPYHLARLLVPTRRRRRHPCAAVWPVYDDDLAHDKAHGAAHDHGRETGLVHHPCA